MLVKAGMTLLCAAGIAFYVRFLVALWHESRPRSNSYWVWLRLGSGEDTVPELPKRRKPATRAA